MSEAASGSRRSLRVTFAERQRREGSTRGNEWSFSEESVDDTQTLSDRALSRMQGRWLAVSTSLLAAFATRAAPADTPNTTDTDTDAERRIAEVLDAEFRSD